MRKLYWIAPCLWLIISLGAPSPSLGQGMQDCGDCISCPLDPTGENKACAAFGYLQGYFLTCGNNCLVESCSKGSVLVTCGRLMVDASTIQPEIERLWLLAASSERSEVELEPIPGIRWAYKEFSGAGIALEGRSTLASWIALQQCPAQTVVAGGD